VVPLLLQAPQRCLQLEWPEEVVGLLEVWANSHDLMDKIFDTDDVVLTKALEKANREMNYLDHFIYIDKFA
jgi:hypothetical protein